MEQAATRFDFFNLSEDQQDRHELVLRALDAQRLPCRCEVAGKEFRIVVAPGLSSAKYWLDKFELNNTHKA